MLLRTFSYGGGWQSTAALVLAAEGEIDFPTFLFANVGDDSEHPDTLRYVREIAMPYALANGIELVELHRRGRFSAETLLENMTRHNEKTGAHIIPLFLSSGKPGMRSCTSNFKIRRIAAWQRAHGASKTDRAITGLGISLDEFQRARTDSGIAWQTLTYPLIDLRLTRQDCGNIITRAGLPIPGKSACWFCPFHNITGWRNMRRDTPELFDKAVALEKRMSDQSEAHGHDRVFLSRTLIPLDRACAGEQLEFDFDDTCESGFCMT